MIGLIQIVCTRKMNEQDKMNASKHGFDISDYDFLSFDYSVPRRAP